MVDFIPLHMSFSRRLVVLCAIILINSFAANAQWEGSYANSWINYDQEYFKVTVNSEGLCRIPFSSLPASIKSADLSKVQMYRGGREISIISIDSNGLLFYGRPNTGESDSLLYRPMSSRVNRYSSLFSSTGAYFITLGKVDGKRSAVVKRADDTNVVTRTNHREDMIQLYESEYSLSTLISIYPKFMNSFYEHGASRSGVRHLGDTLIVTSFSLKNIDRTGNVKPRIKLLFHGRSYFSRNIEVSVGKDINSMRILGQVRAIDFAPELFDKELSYSDFDESGKIYVSYKSSVKDRLERFSLTYANFLFDQKLEMGTSRSKKFYFQGVGESLLKFRISDASSLHKIFEISDIDNPKVVDADARDVVLQSGSKFYVSDEEVIISPERVISTKFEKLDAQKINYIILTNEVLKNASEEYSNYRKSSSGGAYKTAVITINDVYNQFNYGEVSPIAIKRFVDYMVSDKNQNRYLLLVGTSITFVERMRADLAGDVPTVGYPGSDILLVSGLLGQNENVPVIPVGRISASTPDQVLNYLNKVKTYENISSSEASWKKNVLHINGGKTVSEIASFSAELEKLAPLVSHSSLGGEVKKYVKQSLIEVEKVDISADVNNGVGMITYVGHGSQTVTDLDFGYVSQQANGFRNFQKYPLMYFNGCGVGNMFNNRLNENLSASDKMPLALDWLLAKDKGAVSIIANSFDSYLGPSVKYLEMLYEALFVDPSAHTMSIGQIQSNVINKVIAQPGLSAYDIANIHQSVLNGDPAIHLFSFNEPDYAFDQNQGISLHARPGFNIETSDSLTISIPLRNLGGFKSEEIVQIDVAVVYGNNQSVRFTKSTAGWASSETIELKVKNSGEKLVRVDVEIDKQGLLQELNRLNNKETLYVDWDSAKNLSSYFKASNVDVISPIIELKINSVLVKSDDYVSTEPNIDLIVMDDRLIMYEPDMISFSYKSCNDETCSYQEISLDKLEQVSVVQVTDNQYKISFKADFLTDGAYTLLLRVKDAAGNVSGPYIVTVNVRDSEYGSIQVLVTPNPASDYIKFSGRLNNKSVDKASINVYNSRGQMFFKRYIDLKARDGFEEIWEPKGLSGLYFYKLEFSGGLTDTEQINGKIVIVN